MPSEPNAINYLLSGALGAVISSFILLINNCLNNKSQSEREKQQRIWQEKSDDKKWNREKIYDSYRTSIQALTKIIQTQGEMDRNNIATKKLDGKLFNLRIEFLSEFNMAIVDHPDKDSKEFKEKINKVVNQIRGENAYIALETMGKIMDNDSRLKNINE